MLHSPTAYPKGLLVTETLDLNSLSAATNSGFYLLKLLL